MAIFHKSNYGMYQNRFYADLDGYVATLEGEVHTLNWMDNLLPNNLMAWDIASHNKAMAEKSDFDFEIFRSAANNI